MEFHDVDFNAQDARNIIGESKQRKDWIYYRFHANIINQIKQRASRRLTYLVYTVPVYLLGAQVYNPDQVLLWLATKLTSPPHPFNVTVDFNKRKLYISWDLQSKRNVTNVSSGTRRGGGKKKSVKFDLDQNLFHQY